MAVEIGAARAQVERLLGSKTFEASEVHRRLLEYLAEKSLAGEADRLKEYTVGLEAFHKPSTYDPKHDSIVRIHVGRLRQKLAVYYQNEANGDDVLVSVPKGAFKLEFEPRVLAAEQPPPNQQDPARRVRFLAVGLAVAVLWAAVASVAWVRARRWSAPAESWSPELEELWAPLVDGPRPLLVCLGTPLFVRFPSFGFFRDTKANDWQEAQSSERVAAARRGLEQQILPSYNFTGAGEASAGFLLARLLATRKRELRVTRSNILSWQQVTDENVIFIGPPKFNVQLQSAALMEDIVMEHGGVRNRKPRTGEPDFLPDRTQPGTADGETYALITRSRGPSGNGELLVLAGNASADTLAAAEWLTEPWRARELLEKLRAGPGGGNGEIPRHFQVVLKVAFKQGIPVQSSYVFHHALGK
jgi:hypothetical protein